jgi:hypothetical protein
MLFRQQNYGSRDTTSLLHQLQKEENTLAEKHCKENIYIAQLKK